VENQAMKNELRVYLAIWIPAVALALPGGARGTEAVTARLPAAQTWNVEVGASYAATTDFTGWGIALRGGWLPVPYFAVGLGIETTRLHAEGMTSSGASRTAARSSAASRSWPGKARALRRATPLPEGVAVAQGRSSPLVGAFHHLHPVARVEPGSRPSRVMLPNSETG
jgi:hypothetical protein